MCVDKWESWKIEARKRFSYLNEGYLPEVTCSVDMW